MSEPEIVPCPHCGDRLFRLTRYPREQARLECISCGYLLGPLAYEPRVANHAS